ncbi:cysteine dioxygenase [Holotrichia oblita]|uniref:Cysteine dioxygenase n=1 Tax=Holotrichia oblita TaxID=644536 RepID=A0ACB9TPI5_HOLOL|nr:cysteine dioxygenase [Holotrichia oblita]
MEILTNISPSYRCFQDEEHFKVFKGMEKVPVVNTLEELIQKLREVFQSENVNVDYVRALMSSYKSKPSEWRKYAKFDRYRYTRNLVDSGNGKYNLMILCWGEGHGSAIHDHANSHCFMKMLKGSLTEVCFAWPQANNEEMKEIGRKELSLNSVCYINDSIGLHRVENPSNVEGAVSLHLYCPPYDKCTVFNQTTGQKSNAHVTFWSTYGERRNKDIQNIREPEDN